MNSCLSLFEYAQKTSRNLGLPRWGNPIDLKKTTGISTDTTLPQLSHLLISSCGKLAANARPILNEVFFGERLVFETTESFSANFVSLWELFGQFFGHHRVADWPGMVYLQPYYVSMKYFFKPRISQKVHDPVTEKYFRFESAKRNPITLGFGYGPPPLKLNLGQFEFAKPLNWENNMPLLRTSRTRSGELSNSNFPMTTGKDVNVGLSLPTDGYFQHHGHFPSYEGRFQTDPATRMDYHWYRVLHLARFAPIRTWVHARVHQAIIALDPYSSKLLLINTARRSFETFCGCYKHLGVDNMMNGITGW